MVFPCRMIVLMGFVTVFNSILVASIFAVMVVSTLSSYTCNCITAYSPNNIFNYMTLYLE